MPDLLFDVAERIGARLVDQAQWSDDRCTWVVRSEDPAAPGSKRPVTRMAGGDVYQGSAGIALFLMELAALTGDHAIRHTVRGALRHALDWAAQPQPLPFGFHAGRIGVAYAVARYASLTGDDALRDSACRLLMPLVGQASSDMGLDLLSGAAGAIGPLLRLGDGLASELPTTIAKELAEHLINVAERSAGGWSWSPWGVIGKTRDLTGLAHGAAGAGTGLLELYAATGDGAYRYAAEQAFAYEASAYDPRARNWYDYREIEVAYYISRARPVDELRSRMAAGDPTLRAGLKSMSAWCHGAPGIGLTRLRAYQVLGFEQYREESLLALATTAEPEHVGAANFSLCHGVGGNAELLILASEVLGEPRWRDRAIAWAHEGRARWLTAAAWPSGTINAEPDPSLMLGEAGVGYFFLRLAEPRVPSVLLVPGTGGSRRESLPDDRYIALMNADVDRFYGRSISILERFGATSTALRPSAATLRGASVVVRTGRAVDAAIAQADETMRPMLEDAALADRAMAALSLAEVDSADWWLEQYDRVVVDAVDWDHARFTLVPRARLVQSQHRWRDWLTHATTDRPEPEPEVALVYRDGSGVRTKWLAPFPALVLGALAAPATVADVIRGIAEATGASAEDPRLREAVRQQLSAAYAGELIRAA